MLEFWKGKFNQQALTKEQAARDLKECKTKDERRKRMRSRWNAYMGRALGNRKLGMTLIIMGLNVDLSKVATAFARQSAGGDASSLPSRALRQQVLSARSWLRWGRQLYYNVESKRLAWDSLGRVAQEAYTWYSYGWSAEEADRLTKEYGHGLLRTGPEQGRTLGTETAGSVADRVRADLL